ncbi:Hypothetical protein ACI5QL_00849 [Bacillus velezensis]
MMGYSQTFIPKLKTDHASFTLIACVSTSYQTIVNFEHFKKTVRTRAKHEKDPEIGNVYYRNPGLITNCLF